MWGSIYIKPTGTTWWGDGVCDNTVSWGIVYKPYVDCTPDFEIIAENGDFLKTEIGNENLITEYQLDEIIAENGDYLFSQNKEQLITE
tara:strand:+ start:443 stop:706 length:264 start_codon:yes stop_codon:yes gene_type:complete